MPALIPTGQSDYGLLPVTWSDRKKSHLTARNSNLSYSTFVSGASGPLNEVGGIWTVRVSTRVTVSEENRLREMTTRFVLLDDHVSGNDWWCEKSHALRVRIPSCNFTGIPCFVRCCNFTELPSAMLCNNKLAPAFAGCCLPLTMDPTLNQNHLINIISVNNHPFHSNLTLFWRS